MKKESRKLTLNRETLAPMQGDDLANVNGGAVETATINKTIITNTIRTTVLTEGNSRTTTLPRPPLQTAEVLTRNYFVTCTCAK
jgi:hypothetical protein